MEQQVIKRRGLYRVEKNEWGYEMQRLTLFGYTWALRSFLYEDDALKALEDVRNKWNISGGNDVKWSNERINNFLDSVPDAHGFLNSTIDKIRN